MYLPYIKHTKHYTLSPPPTPPSFQVHGANIIACQTRDNGRMEVITGIHTMQYNRDIRGQGKSVLLEY